MAQEVLLPFHNMYNPEPSVFAKLVDVGRNLDENDLLDLYLRAKKLMAIKMAKAVENDMDIIRISDEEAQEISKQMHLND